MLSSGQAFSLTAIHVMAEYVQTFATLPQTTHVFFGGMNPPIIYRAFNRLTGLPIAGYSADTLSIFFTLNASLSTKLVMIYGQPPPPTLSPRVGFVVMDGLFMRDISSNGYITSSPRALFSPSRTFNKTDEERSQALSPFTSTDLGAHKIPPIIDPSLVS